MTAVYKEKIVQTFRDNAIRSVLLIDDDYLSYERLIEEQSKLLHSLVDMPQPTATTSQTVAGNISSQISDFNASLKQSNRAKEFVNFFHKQKLICDVESELYNLNHEKIRKSDLVVLDYHLVPGAPTPSESSLQLLSKLSQSKHMNMVVVYTKEKLSDVWLEIASTLRGSKSTELNLFFDGNQDLIDSWNNNSNDWEEVWRSVDSRCNREAFLKLTLDASAVWREVGQLCKDKSYEEPSLEHVDYLMELAVKGHNKTQNSFTNLDVHGTPEKWLQAGDVFVVLCEKRKLVENTNAFIDSTPNEVWDSIESSLLDWYPNFYRVITSELQNQIEDTNLSMEKILSKGHFEQASALWGILRVAEENRIQAANDLLLNLLRDISERIQEKTNLHEFIRIVANNTIDQMPPFVKRESDVNSHNAYINESMNIALKNQKEANLDLNCENRLNVAHAFNEQLCIGKNKPRFISTGVISKWSRDGGHTYYLCIAPSCNTIPKQLTGNIAVEMTPHRPMRFIRLEAELLTSKVIKTAHQADTIFITDDGERLALKIFEKNQDGPTIEQGVVVNHDSDDPRQNGAKEIQFFITKNGQLEVETRQFNPIAKLRAGFASRYQNTQLQYEARIGVDFVSANIS